MNKRIKNLIELATSTQGPTPYNPLTFEVFDREKFAKLVAADCAELARDIGTNTNPDDWALDKCYEIEQRIRDRYGVEE